MHCLYPSKRLYRTGEDQAKIENNMDRQDTIKAGNMERQDTIKAGNMHRQDTIKAGKSSVIKCSLCLARRHFTKICYISIASFVDPCL